MRGMKQLPIERTAALHRADLDSMGTWSAPLIHRRGYNAMIALRHKFTTLGARRVRRLRNQIARALRFWRSW